MLMNIKIYMIIFIIENIYVSLYYNLRYKTYNYGRKRSKDC